MRNRIFTALVAVSLVSLAACGGRERAPEGTAADTAGMTGMDTMATAPMPMPMDTTTMRPGMDTMVMRDTTAMRTDTMARDTAARP